MLQYLKSKYSDIYDYEMTDITKFENELAYVVSFTQKKQIADPLLCGKMYIDKKTYAILGAEFEINPLYIEKTKNDFVVKNKKRVSINPVKISYRVSYKIFNGKYFVNHVRGEMDFKIRKRKHLFYSNYYLFFEMATSEIITTNVKKFKNDELNDPSSIFSEAIPRLGESFWGNNIIIEPEVPFEKALSIINEKILKSK